MSFRNRLRDGWDQFVQLVTPVEGQDELIAVRDGVAYKASVDDLTSTIGAAQSGYANYADTATDTTPIALTADTWINLTNDGLGAESQERLPAGVSTLLHSSGAIDPSSLPLDSEIFIRQDYEVTPSSNNASLQFRYSLGAGLFVLEEAKPRLDRGAGIPYKFSLVLNYVYIGNEATKNNLILIQANLSTPGTLVNRGMAISVRKKT